MKAPNHGILHSVIFPDGGNSIFKYKGYVILDHGYSNRNPMIHLVGLRLLDRYSHNNLRIDRDGIPLICGDKFKLHY